MTARREAAALFLFVSLVAASSAVLLPPASAAGTTTYHRLPDDIFVPVVLAEPTLAPTPEPSAVPTPVPTRRPRATPTPAPGDRRVGVASWYEGSRDFHGIRHVALPDSDWDGTIHGYARICVLATGVCTRAAIVDYCQCYRRTPDERVVDLSIETVRALRLDPSRGLYKVSVDIIEGGTK